MSPSPLPRALPRAVVGPLAVLGVLALGVAPAGAAAGLTVPLSPDRVEVRLYGVENSTPPDADDDGFAPVEVEWGGAVDLRLPGGLDGSAATYLLETGAETDPEPTRTLSSEVPGAGHLDVAGVPGGAVRISLPTDATSGPLGLLTVAGVTGTVPGVEVAGDLTYLLEFTGSGTTVVPLAPVVDAFSGLPCTYLWSAVAPDPVPGAGAGDQDDCAPYEVPAGSTVDLTLPADSLLRTVGLDGLTDLTAVLVRTEFAEDDGYAAGFDSGYTDGHAAGLQAGPAAVHVPAHGPSFDAARAGADPDYAAGYDEGHAYGWDDATLVPDPGVDPDGDADGGTSQWSWLVAGPPHDEDVVSGSRPVEPAAGAEMARVAAAAQAVEETSSVADVDEDVAVDEPGDDRVLSVTPTAAGAQLTVPSDVRAGGHALLLTTSVDATSPVWSVYLELDVTAAPAAVAPVAAPPGQPAVAPVVNPGLASNTGWTEPAPAGASVALVALGGSALLVAGLGAAVVLRPRRRPVAAAQD